MNIKELSDNQEVFQLIASNYREEDEHWGANIDEIIGLINKMEKKYVVWVDTGCGPGHHIQQVIDRDSINKGLEIIGIDYSRKMLEEAEKRLHKYQNVTLRQGDITDHDVLPEADIITCLNNTFGNLLKEGDGKVARNQFLDNVRSSLNNDGYFLLSVYDLDKIDDTYGQNLTLLHKDYENGDFVVEYKKASGSARYYSHWFTEAELRNLLADNNFGVERIKEDNMRLIAIAK